MCSICRCSVRRTLALARVASVGSNVVIAERCRAVLYRSRGERQYVRADWPVTRDLSRVRTAERHHRVRNHLERPRRKRGQRRSELRATIGGSGIGMPAPLASEHHGDEHLEPSDTPLQAIAAVDQWRSWPRSCVCVLWGDHGFMPSLRRGAAGHAQSRLQVINSTAAEAHAVPHSRGACVRRTMRAARATCAAHRQ